jgi:thiol:disulfide interchange protein
LWTRLFFKALIRPGIFMKRTIYTLSFLFFTSIISGQNLNVSKPVNWSFSAKKIAPGSYELSLRGAITKGWKLFSITATDNEPNTRFYLDSGTMAFATIKNLEERGNLRVKKEPLLENLEIKYFEDNVDIAVTIDAPMVKNDIMGNIAFMAIEGDSIIGPETIPFRFAVDASGNPVVKNTELQESFAGAQLVKRNNIQISNPVNKFGGTGAENSKSTGLWSIFLLGFLGGLVGLIMPCTFPMIPLTVSFFTKKSETKAKGIFNAFMYGFFIFIIYVLLSVPFYFLDAGSSDILNNISTNAWLNIFFAIVFVVFAISFFGYFEISLPSGVTNKVDAKSSVGSLGGIFFMALTLAIVSFSCTGPILGSLLVGALNQDGDPMQLTVAMAGFGLALGLPFGLFALFPRWLSSLPRSGGWMDTVKVVFGFIELAFAIKFISNADLVEHWNLLKREVFLGVWIVVGVCIVLYLLGVIRFKHDGPLKKIAPLRWAFIVLFAAITLYMVPGITKTKWANLTLFSGITPPLSYSIYGKELIRLNGVEANIINDYEKALAQAKMTNKPLLIDFTGWACANCRRMEENVWTNPQIKELIEAKFILVSLYVDDRKQLPEADQFLYTSADGSKKAIKTVGDKYITLQSENFSNASQPLYAILSPGEQLLNFPVGYTPDKDNYLKWLQNGLDAFEKKQ